MLRRTLVLAPVLALTLAACGSADTTTETAGSGASTAPSSGATGFEAVLEQARGQTVDWYMYGGDDRLNAYVGGYVTAQLAALDITLNQVRINDTAEAVNKVLGELAAGRTEGGSVDLIWINGENFATLKQADAVECGYVEDLPAIENVDLTTPGIATDFGLTTDGCEVPWQQTTSSLVYDSSALTEADVASVESLFAWSKDNPGRFTYAAPPDFNGSMAVRTFFFDTAGGAEQFLGDFDQAAFDEVSGPLFARLNDVEPSLWRGGQTYPAGQNDVETLFANGEIDAYLTYGSSGVGDLVERGTLPETTRSAVFQDGNIGNYSFTLIPKNAGDKAAAKVLANLLLTPEAALENAGPDGAGFTSAIDLSLLDAAVRAQFEELAESPYQVPAAELAAATLPEVVSEYVTALEEGWRTQVQQQ